MMDNFIQDDTVKITKRQLRRIIKEEKAKLAEIGMPAPASQEFTHYVFESLEDLVATGNQAGMSFPDIIATIESALVTISREGL